MTGRLSCIVPFCRCTAAADRYSAGTEIICAKHWRAVSADTKARKRLVERRVRKLARTGQEQVPARHQCAAVWARCKAEAIEAAGGIG